METAKLLDWWEKSGRFGLIGMGLGLMILGSLWMLFGFQNQAGDVQFYTSDEISKPPSRLIVDVRGAVKKPGVYELDSDSRLEQALTKAGGYSGQADLDWVDKNLNHARKLTDGEKIYIPARDNPPENFQFSNSNSQTNQETIKSERYINLNTASQAELETLPGIGPSFAQRIIDYRDENNGFKSIEEIQAVSGIGEKTFQKIKEQISI